MIRRLVLLALLAVPGQALAECRNVTHKGSAFTVCEARAGDDLRLWHSTEEGRLLGSFGAVEDSLRPGEALSFAMNAGMYHQDRRPVGLYVEDRREVTPLVDGGGYGNFGLVPNGVFCIGDGTLRVIETQSFRESRPDCRFATQSGPMVVVGGDLHPRLLPGSDSRLLRNGVGTSADGERAVFVISDEPVNFHDFATLFRDRLGMRDALYLDGRVSRLFAPELDRFDGGFPMGPIVGLVTHGAE